MGRYQEDSKGWVLNFNYADEPDSDDVLPERRRVFYIKENQFWDSKEPGGQRVLKTFRPNMKYPNTILVPEQQLKTELDRLGDMLGKQRGVENLSPDTIQKRTDWLRQTCVAFSEGDVGAGRDIFKLNDIAMRFPTFDEVKNGSWRAGDGWFSYCDKKGNLLTETDGKTPLRPFGTDLTMGPNEERYRNGNFNYCNAGERARNGTGCPGVTGFSPDRTWRVHPTEGNPQGRPVRAASNLVHEKNHGWRAKRGAGATGKEYVRLPYPFVDKGEPVSMEEILTTGEYPERDRSVDIEKIVDRVKEQRAQIVRQVGEDGDISADRKLELREFDERTRANDIQYVRRLQYVNERIFTLDMYRCPGGQGGHFAMPPEEVQEYLPVNYLDGYTKPYKSGNEEKVYTVQYMVSDPSAKQLDLVELPNGCAGRDLD
ncbi:hypothetical protein [Mycobacteroides abscessus]|uniref:hypothetical protein n=1 Tax=Mycobacteroides abscessus TaxID=36809 RepID=UPI0010570EB2|nr:hypothetical protein [Mycobacteroides abscessus]